MIRGLILGLVLLVSSVANGQATHYAQVDWLENNTAQVGAAFTVSVVVFVDDTATPSSNVLTFQATGINTANDGEVSIPMTIPACDKFSFKAYITVQTIGTPAKNVKGSYPFGGPKVTVYDPENDCTPAAYAGTLLDG